ncbi:MAG: hypothetical protein BWY74_03282 [Firmicutes bacterium ADurb.Bin419]|nr:MAG: hypothetical protein BWY74_03282 [Firmicutes bacterium ADurb.Bin419]
MQVKPFQKRAWAKVFEREDIQKIVEASKTPERPNGIHKFSISRAYHSGKMTETTYEVMKKYFDKKIADKIAELKSVIKTLEEKE